MEKILVSACLLGQPVRYDGKHKSLQHAVLDTWQQEGRLITICPEVSGGLSIPRPAAELQQNGTVITTNGQNVTAAFEAGAITAFNLCKQHNIRFALLKERSPSCGSNYVYDGTFSGNIKNGVGLTAQYLMARNIQVYSEETIRQLIEKITA